MASLPWFKVYAREMLADSRFSAWTMDERGAWLTLLLHNWHDGSIPSGLTALSKLLHVESSEMSRIWSAIGDRFVPHPLEMGRLVSPRLEEERDKADQLIQKRALAGEKGANERWHKGNQPHGKRMRLPPQPHGKPNATAMANDSDPDIQPPDTRLQLQDSQTDRAWLSGLQRRLAVELQLPKPLGVGKDATRVETSFRRWLDAVGEDFTVSECARVARDAGVAPSNLSWWPGWLDTVSDAELARWSVQLREARP